MYSADFIQALKDTGIPVAHFGWESDALPRGDFIVYAEDSSEDLEGDGQHIERATDGTVHYYTRDYSPNAKAVVESVFRADPTIVWNLETINFEEDTRFIHYAWEVGQYGR